MKAIETFNLTKTFDRVTAVNKLTLGIDEGEIFGFLGPNGAGKSTTIRMLCGILQPTEGTAQVGGFDVIKEPERVKETIGYMSQSFGLYQDLTAAENLRFSSRLYIADRKEATRREQEVVELIGLGPYHKVLAANLSGGWRQRLALACAVVHRPRILFLDEPTAGIDPVSRRMIWDFLYDMAAGGMTLFVTTHYMEEAERCNKIGFIWEGNLVACDTPQGVKDNFNLHQIINVKSERLTETLKLLKSLDAVKDASLYGDELHLAVDDAGQAFPMISRALEEHHIPVKEMNEIKPSIEDVFVALSRKDQ
jgi:ABC-2 type transport system ATP-binding protein